MKNKLYSNKKFIALFILIVLVLNVISPVFVYAITSGPSQPEMEKFEPAGVNDMVSLFTGDFKQNIPLLDVGGYPINLAYQSGGGIEDEASWVGMGWTLNPGAVNRNMRGLPDDFKGDLVMKSFNKKPFKKVGAEVRVKKNVFGVDIGSISARLNLYKDNYFGIGASFGAGIDYSLSKSKATPLTLGLGLDFDSDTRDGLNISPSFSLTKDIQEKKEKDILLSLSGSLSYNTRAGLKQITLGQSFSTQKTAANSKSYDSHSGGFSATHYFGQSYTPTINNSSVNNGYTFSIDFGPTAFGLYTGVGGTGYTYSEKLLDQWKASEAYGYLYYLNGRKKLNALIDFNREKDGVFLTSSPSIPTPVSTPDFFLATGQSGSQQFRPFYAGNYVVFDQANENRTNNLSMGATVGVINIFTGGGRINYTSGKAKTSKWDNNLFTKDISEPDFLPEPLNVAPVSFKQVGEMSKASFSFMSNITGYNYSTNIHPTRRVVIRNNNDKKAEAYKSYVSREENNVVNVVSAIKKSEKDPQTNVMTYLTARDATKYGVDKKIKNYSTGLNYTEEDRIDNHKKAHHISEIRVTDNEGKRMVYGIPVYNIKNQEVSFSVNMPSNKAEFETSRKKGLISYVSADASLSNKKGRDWTFSSVNTPSYATSYLLTSILSPDYVDLKNDGVTDDDLGSGIKFNYRKLTSANKYKWRTPYELNKANYNEGFLSDTKDDKASFVYGEKDVWYLHSIESKTMIAIFHLSNRVDALGVSSEMGGKDVSLRLQKLDKISLYSKSDYLKNFSNALPIKEVHFVYDYSLYPHIHNNSEEMITGIDPDNHLNTNFNLNTNKGKLTLRKVFFTFGKNLRGKSNPYEFKYDMRKIYSYNSVVPSQSSANGISNLPIPTGNTPWDEDLQGLFANRVQDRWGNYRPSYFAKLKNDGKSVFINSEYPYTTQEDENTTFNERELADRLVSMWQLNEVVTPTGAVIKVEYEADDYAYVQNKRAMQMCSVSGLRKDASSTTNLIESNKIVIDLPWGSNISDPAILRKRYFDGMNVLFYKFFIDIDQRGHYEYVQGYAEISDIDFNKENNIQKAIISLKPVEGKNPISRAAWQMLKLDLPQFAYDNYDNSEVGDGLAAIKSILQSFANFGELFQPYFKRAERKKFASKVDVSKSFVRLYQPNCNKIGGGSRVKKLTITDMWAEMTNVNNVSGNKSATYGQLYDYTTESTEIKDANGTPLVISSGVATYEPQIGNEENPFHEPVSYTSKVHWSTDNYHYIEKPYCETYFPAAEVGYSVVKVTNLGNNDAKETGYIVNEFYTAKDFPVIVDLTTLDQNKYNTSFLLKLFASTSIKKMTTSQGFKIELNDMHGKQKSQKVFNTGNSLVSSTEYFYQVENPNSITKKLDNRVDVLEQDASISSKQLIGTDVELITDVRESENNTIGGSVGAYVGMFYLPPFFTVPFGSVIVWPSISLDKYNSISFVKVVHQYGILTKVKSMQNGSTIETENLLWDGKTGQVLLSKVQNEYDDFTFNFNYPAHMVKEYEGMGGAYKNVGATLTGVSSDQNGIVNNTFQQFLFPGDELVWISDNLNESELVWVIESADGTKRLIDKFGKFITSNNKTYTILRSGRRNLVSASVGTVICSKDPRVNGKLNLNLDKNILDSKAIEYTEQWSTPVADVLTPIPTNDDFLNVSTRLHWKDFCNELVFTHNNNSVFLNSIIEKWLFYAIYNKIPNTNKSLLLSHFTPYTIEQIIGSSNIQYQCSFSTISNSFFTNTSNSSVSYYTFPAVFAPSATSSIPNLHIGTFSNGYYIQYDYVHPEFNALLNSSQSVVGNTLLQVDNSNQSFYNKRHAVYNQTNNNNLAIPMHYVFSKYDENSNYTELLRFHFIPTVNYNTSECKSPIDKPINPYYTNVLGNWRPQTNYVYTVNRSVKKAVPEQKGGTDIRKSGFYTAYTPFWQSSPNGFINNLNVDFDKRWVWSNKSVYFDRKGNEVESVDALKRYSAALYGYDESAVTAVAVNARHNEIAFDGFEDYKTTSQVDFVCPLNPHLKWKNWYHGSLSELQSHTGKFSYKFSGNNDLSLDIPFGNVHPPFRIFKEDYQNQNLPNLLSYDVSGRYILNANELVKGFSPIENKRYLLSLWVQDGSPNSNNISNNFSVSLNGQSIFSQGSINNNSSNKLIVPVVEGWKLLEIPFTVPSNTANTGYFTLDISSGGSNIYVDDFRIHPFDAQMNGYVYDYLNMRLLSQIDENNFATFYEYDDEGTPIRVKKETEKGIVTLKENRKFFKKR